MNPGYRYSLPLDRAVSPYTNRWSRWATARSLLFTSQVTMNPDSRPMALPSRTHLIVDLRTMVVAFFGQMSEGSEVHLRSCGRVLAESENRPWSGRIRSLPALRD